MVTKTLRYLLAIGQNVYTDYLFWVKYINQITLHSN